MEARVTAQSQADRLRERMEEARISHGHVLRADLSHIGVRALAENGEGQVLFLYHETHSSEGSCRSRRRVAVTDDGHHGGADST